MTNFCCWAGCGVGRCVFVFIVVVVLLQNISTLFYLIEFYFPFSFTAKEFLSQKFSIVLLTHGKVKMFPNVIHRLITWKNTVDCKLTVDHFKTEILLIFFLFEEIHRETFSN